MVVEHILLGRKIKSTKYIKRQVVSSDTFCNTWVDLMRDEDFVGRKSKL